MKIGQVIRIYRNATCQDQAAMARELNIGVTVLSRLESGDRAPSGDTLIKILIWLFGKNELPHIREKIDVR